MMKLEYGNTISRHLHFVESFLQHFPCPLGSGKFHLSKACSFDAQSVCLPPDVLQITVHINCDDTWWVDWQD